MIGKLMFLLAVLAASGSAALGGGQEWTLGNEYYSVRATDAGLLTASGAHGTVRILSAYARARFRLGAEEHRLDSSELGPWSGRIESGDGAETLVLTVETPAPSVRLTWTITAVRGRPGFTAALDIENLGPGEIDLKELTPLRAELGRGGGAFIGQDPARAWILENGYRMTMNFWVRLLTADQQSISDWNSIAYDPGSGEILLGGFLTGNIASLAQVRSTYRSGQGIADSGRTALTAWSGYAAYEPHKLMAPGAVTGGEIFYVNFADSDPHRALEGFADLCAEYNDIRLWPGPTPTGWNSWATGFHHAIDQESMTLEAAAAARLLLDYGLTTFQVDDPWQVRLGDWEADPERFPDGVGALIERFRVLGFRMFGLWLAPFSMRDNSQVYADNPHWALRLNPVGAATMGENWRALDLSHPEVKEHLRRVFTGLKQETRLNWLKLDFIYYALGGAEYYDKTKTNVEIFRDALAVIRESVGEDTFIMLIAVPILAGLGYADGMRLGLDITPEWNDSPDYSAQGVKPKYMTAARRYYLNRRVWFNHPDMWYLGVAEEEQARWGSHLTLNEARFYASFVGLTGPITKIGNRFTGLDEERIDLVIKLLPPIDTGARPVDLFEMRYPEIWSLSGAGAGFEYNAVALMNWGYNLRWGVEIEERERTVGADLERLGLDPGSGFHAFGFWGQEYLGLVSGRLERLLPPREMEVVFLTRALERPALIGTNRHVAGFLSHLTRAESGADFTETLFVESDPGFDYRFTFFAPEGFAFSDAETLGGLETIRTWSETAPAPGGSLVTVGFMTPTRASVRLTVAFDKGE